MPTRWNYALVRGDGPESLLREIEGQDADGWELVSVVSHDGGLLAFMKRQEPSRLPFGAGED